MTTGRRIAALFLTLALAACGDENTYYDLAPTDPEKTGQDEAGIEADAGQPAPEEEEVSAPLFIRTPKLYASVVGGALYIYGDPEVIALSAATGGLLIERLRLWLPPCGNAGGYAAGKITLSVLDDTAARVYIKAIETQVMARDEIVERPERLVDGDVRLRPVDLVEVDPVRLKALEALFQREADVVRCPVVG